MIELTSGDYRVVVDPKRGGSLSSFEWAGIPILRASEPGSILETACFPLVPFSNRIARGVFSIAGRAFRIAPNFLEADKHSPLHGFGWLSEWQAVSASEDNALIEHVYPGGDWPWTYRARQQISLSENGVLIGLELTNCSEDTMPAGLGLHPYFPRTADTQYHGLHRAEWQVDKHCLPVSLIKSEESRDWWDGQPVSMRCVDTAYVGREGTLSIHWPDKDIGARIIPSKNLATTVVYTPQGENFFCVEPVSHETNAINLPGSRMTMLQSGETMQAYVRIEVSAASANKQQSS